MPSIKDKGTVDKIAEVFCGEGKRNKTDTMRVIGYDEAYADSGKGHKTVYGNIRVIEAIAKIDAQNTEKREHNKEIALKNLYTDYGYLEKAALTGNIAAIRARTAIMNELNHITGQHVTTVISDDKQQRELSDKEKLMAKRLAQISLKDVG